MQEQASPLSLRLPSGTRERVERLASRERRSINSQIIVLIERALPAEETNPERKTA